MGPLPTHFPDSPSYSHPPAEPKPSTKRIPAQPREGVMLVNVKPETITAIPYDIIKEGLQ
jgi:hypothetical protein